MPFAGLNENCASSPRTPFRLQEMRIVSQEMCIVSHGAFSVYFNLGVYKALFG